jgi:hypothetical protein
MNAGSPARQHTRRKQDYVVAVLAANEFDGARLSGVMHTVLDAGDADGDVIKSITLEPRAFGRFVATRALQLPKGHAGLPSVVRVPSLDTADSGAAIASATRDWRAGFGRNDLEWQLGTDPSPVDADGVLVLLPTLPVGKWNASAAESDPIACGEAIAARYSIWLMLLLVEFQRVMDVRRAQGVTRPEIPVAFIAGSPDEHKLKDVFAREIDLFNLVVGDASFLALAGEGSANRKIVERFAQRLTPHEIPDAPVAPPPIRQPAPAATVNAKSARGIVAPRRGFLAAIATAIIVIAGAAVGYQQIWGRSSGIDVAFDSTATPLVMTARYAIAAALEGNSLLTDDVRRARINNALTICTRPSAECPLRDVLRLGAELKRLRE